jgi:hypothetical protein
MATGATTPSTAATAPALTILPGEEARPNSWKSRIARAYCRNRAAFWLGLGLTVVFLGIATAMNIHYQCWRWRTDPVGAAVLERRRRRLPTPYSFYA